MRDGSGPGGVQPPGSRLRRLAALPLAATLAALAAACSGSSGDEPANATAGPPPPPPAAAAGCGGVRPSLGCEQIEVDGRVYRYALRAGAGAPGEVALVDLGGPGRALFAADDVAGFAGAWPGEETLLFVEEPWVTRPLDAPCAAALTAFQRGLRAEERRTRQAAALVAGCDLRTPGAWGWTPERHRRVVERIVEAKGLELVGVVATSYGAARTEPLWELASVRWLILSSPAARAATGSRYVDGRASGALAAFTAACPSCRGAAGARRLVASTSAELARRPVELDTRTPAVEPVDLEAALLTVAYLPPAERARFAASLRRPAAESAAWIGLLSDAALMRYGEYEMSPAMLAYLAEVCARYGPWPAAAPDGVLAALHAPCRLLAGRARPPRSAGPRRVCVAHGTEDFVTARAAAEDWASSLGAPRVTIVRGAPHGSAGLASRCARELGLAAGA